MCGSFYRLQPPCANAGAMFGERNVVLRGMARKEGGRGLKDNLVFFGDVSDDPYEELPRPLRIISGITSKNIVK